MSIEEPTTAPAAIVQGGEYISPEGVEERIELVENWFVTMTGGGRFRVYYIRNGEEMVNDLLPTSTTKDTLANELAKRMAVTATFIATDDKAGFIKRIFDAE